VFLVYTLGVAFMAWAGSVLDERHALNWAAPIVYMLLGRTIERHRAWFRAPVFVAFLLATQAIVHRVFWATPQPDGNYREQAPPPVLLTPIGDGVSYMDLFVSQTPPDMVVAQFAEFVALGVIVFIWLGRRAQLTGHDVPTGRAAVATHP
jgi:hypothetical protein